MFFRHRSVLTPELDDAIFNDFLHFYDLECKLHDRNADRSSTVNDNVCENIALLDPASLSTVQGVDRIKYLFGSKSPVYWTGKRIRIFTSSCYIRYGAEVMDEYKERCLSSLKQFTLSNAIIRMLDRQFNTFWTLPLFIRAYNNFAYRDLTK